MSSMHSREPFLLDLQCWEAPAAPPEPILHPLPVSESSMLSSRNLFAGWAVLGSCSGALHTCAVNSAQDACGSMQPLLRLFGSALGLLTVSCAPAKLLLSVLMGLHPLSSSGSRRLTYSLLLFNALGDHGLVLAIQRLHKQVVFSRPLQLRSIDDLHLPTAKST